MTYGVGLRSRINFAAYQINGNEMKNKMEAHILRLDKLSWVKPQWGGGGVLSIFLHT